MTHKEIQHIDVAHKVWKIARETLHCQVVQVLQETAGFQVNSEMFYCLGTQSERISIEKLRFMNRLPRMEMFQILKSEGLVSFQESCSNQISHYWSTFQLLVWFCKMNLKNFKSGSTNAYVFIVNDFLSCTVCFCDFTKIDCIMANCILREFKKTQASQAEIIESSSEPKIWVKITKIY